MIVTQALWRSVRGLPTTTSARSTGARTAPRVISLDTHTVGEARLGSGSRDARKLAQENDAKDAAVDLVGGATRGSTASVRLAVPRERSGAVPRSSGSDPQFAQAMDSG